MRCFKIRLIVLVIVLVSLLTGCSSPSTQLSDTLGAYNDVISKELPEDIQLTIYYMDPTILTVVALNTDDLINADYVTKIVVKREALTEQIALLSKLKPSILEPVEEEAYLNVRLYYVLETSAHGKILEVSVNEPGGSVFVNGIEVKHNPVFYEIIKPFLSEEDIAILSRTFSGKPRDLFSTGEN